MRYNIELSGERLKQERESIKCIVSRDENDKKIIALAGDDNPDATTMTQKYLLAYMRQNHLDTIGRNKLSALENGDHKAFYSMTLSQWSAFCDVFGVSFEYLTGQEPYKTPTIKALCKITGLSAPAAGLLQTWNQDKPRYVEIISDLLVNPVTAEILNKFIDLYAISDIEKSNSLEALSSIVGKYSQKRRQLDHVKMTEQELDDFGLNGSVVSSIVYLLNKDRDNDRTVTYQEISRLSGNLAESYYQSKAGD